jgi:flagellar biosynthesis protein FlhF
MLEALQEIQRELGPEAIVLSMREIPAGPLWQVWNKPGVEVVATRDISGKGQAETPIPIRYEPSREAPVVPGRKEIDAILSALAEKTQASGFEKGTFPVADRKPSNHNRLEGDPVKWTTSVVQKTKDNTSDKPALQVLENVVRELKGDQKAQTLQAGESKPEIPQALRSIKKRMLNQGIDFALVEHIITTNLNALSPSILEDEYRLKRFMKKQLEANLRPQQNSMAIIQSRVLCLVGSSGSGKTSTLAKMAAYYTKTLGKKVVWVCADTIRAAAISETKTYTDVLNIPLFFAYSPQELAENIQNQADADLILVDTTGISMVDEDRIVELGSYLSVLPGRSIYITAPATMKESDVLQAIATFSPFKIRGLVVTKMDETYTYGSIFNVTHKTNLPILFFTDGHKVLGNLHQGDPAGLVSYLFGEGLNS